MKRYRWTAVGMSTTPRIYETEEKYVRAKDHDHEVEILKDTITALTHDYYAVVDRAERAETSAIDLEAKNERLTDIILQIGEALDGEAPETDQPVAVQAYSSTGIFYRQDAG